MTRAAGPTKKPHPIKPIGNLEDIVRIRAILNRRPRDLLFFDLATQTGARVNRLLELKVKDLLPLTVGNLLPFGDGSRPASQPAVMNQAIYSTFQHFLREINPSEEEYLFKSRKGSKPLDVTSISHLVRRWFKEANLVGLTSVRSLRKTWELHFKPAFPAPSPEQEVGLKVFKPVQTSTLREVVYKELFGAILSGQLPPGSRLMTKDIARQMNVSPMPVREALARLEAGGLVSWQKKRAYLVNELSQENMEEIYSLRRLLEVKAIELACPNCTEETIRQLEYLLAQCLKVVPVKNASDVITFLQHNREWRFTLYRAANRPILVQVIDWLWDKVTPYLHLLIREIKTYDLKKGLDYYQGAINALKRKDCPEACRQLLADMTYAEKSMIAEFQSLKGVHLT